LGSEDVVPVTPTYPGVYIEEIPSGVHTITGVATSVAAFIGTFERGPLNAALRLLSFSDFEREYGGLDRNSETSYAVQQFFNNGGQQCWVVRVADTETATPAQPAKATLHAQPKTGGTAVLTVTAGRLVNGTPADDAGAWGNYLRVEIDYDTADFDNQFNLTVSEDSVAGGRTTVVQRSVYRNLTMASTSPNYAIDVVNRGSTLVQLSAPGNVRPASTGTLGAPLPVDPTTATFPADKAKLDVTLTTDPGSGSITYGPITVEIEYGSASPPTTYAQLRPFLEAAIRSAAVDTSIPAGLKPMLSGASVSLVGPGVTHHQVAFYVQLGRNSRPFDPRATIEFGNTVAGDSAVRLSGAGVTVNWAQYVLSGGSDGPPPAAGTTFRPVPEKFFAGTLGPPKTGMYALEDVDLFNILCIPEATTMAAADMQALYAEAERYVESRRAMLIIDIPPDVTRLDQMQTWIADHDSLRHRNAAVYFPRTNIPDPLNQNRPRSIGASGTIAGLYARTDSQRGVWKAPAGTEASLRNVASLGYLLTDLENGVLNPIGVNCLRNFPIYSNICWGARTLEGADLLASDWKYVPIRRLTLYLEESLYRGTKWVVFEPNDEPLWAQIRLNVGSFMQDLFRKGAFQGTMPSQAYFVKCDSETTTQDDINKGIVNIRVGFAPLKPAEFVILQIRQIASGATA
jgi:phage tail sheath protein FI